MDKMDLSISMNFKTKNLQLNVLIKRKFMKKKCISESKLVIYLKNYPELYNTLVVKKFLFKLLMRIKIFNMLFFLNIAN